jgi:hypothetical protein
VTEWYKLFPSVFDNKVLSFQADYFGKTILGKVFEKCENDKRLKDILGFKYDLDNGFKNYYGSARLEHYHEAAYDAMMTGFCFAKILKYKEIDDAYHQKKKQNASKKNTRKPKKAGENDAAFEEGDAAQKIIPEPKDLHNSPINLAYFFS